MTAASSVFVVEPVASPAPMWRWLASALDELDYGILLLEGGARIVHINDAARDELDERHPLEIDGRELRARFARDVVPLHDAVATASSRGLRHLLTLGDETTRTSVSVIPLDAKPDGSRAVMVVLGKRAVCEELSVHAFARGHRLTAAETRVLAALCEGVSPLQASRRLGVAVSTVRSQIGSIRTKTGAISIRALVQQVALLPPVKGALRQLGASRQAERVEALRLV